jgi:hypothetical protein
VTLARSLLAAALALAIWAPTAGADANLNNLDCRGHIEAGKPAPGDDSTQVQYVFACGGPITGYQIQPQIGDSGFSTDTSVFDNITGAPIVTDSFTCAGDFPGWGFNCTGKYSGNYGKVVGQFAIDGKLCDEPRVDPLLTVVTATATSSGVVTQSMSGPFDLGRPRGCKPSANSGKTRIPGSAVKPAKKAKAKAKAKA